LKRANFSRVRISLLSLIAGLVWAVFSCEVAAQQNGAPLIKSYSASDINSDALGWTTTQGGDGALYFGCSELLRFDGERWDRFSVGGAQAIRGLDFANESKLWAAALGEVGWFERQTDNTWSYKSLVPRLPVGHAPLGEVWYAFADGPNAIFVTAEKVLRWNGQKFDIWSFPSSRRLTAMRSSGKVYFHDFSSGLYCIGKNGPELVISSSILGKAAVQWLEARDDGFLLATSRGLAIYNKGHLWPYAPEASDFIRQNIITSAVRLADGRLAIGTYQGGLVLVGADGSLDQVLSESRGLPNNSIFSLYVDRDKNLWATSSSSIFSISTTTRSTIFDSSFGLPAQPIRHIVRNGENIALATDNTLFEFKRDSGKFEPLDLVPKRMSELQPISDGLLVAGLGGAMKVSNKTVTVLHQSTLNVTAIRRTNSNPDSMFLAEGRNVVLLQSDGSSRIVVKNLPDPANSIAEDSRGNLWIGTYTQGVYFAKPDTANPVEAVQASAGLPNSSGIGRVVSGRDGQIFAFLATKGWWLDQRSGLFVPVRGFPARNVSAISDVAADGTVWIAHPATVEYAPCIAQISISNNQPVWRPHSVDALSNIGIPESIFVESADGGNALLWIGGTTGLLRNVVTGGPIAPAPRAPLVQALAKGKNAGSKQSILEPLPYSTRAISFEFAAPEFARRPTLHLESMLDGIDQAWIPADLSSRREFTALREGSYNFRVRAVAETGVLSPVTSTHFEITPPWWRTATAIICFVLALLPIGYGLYQWRIRILRQQNANLEEKVHQRTAQLAKASAAKTQFVAHMSHEIRNPLNGIVGLALELEDTALDLRQSEIVATLRECTTYLSTLVDDVLDFSSIEAGRVDLRPRPFSPDELLCSIAAMLKIEAIASGASLHVESDPLLPREYMGDAGRIQQVLVNFVSNAMKYSGGRITLAAAIPEDAREEVEFSVSDEGPGISEEGQKILFTKFTRLTDTHSKEITGTGLGLASCRLLAGLMGGAVGVHSAPGHGARFFLRLPLEIFSAATPDAPAAPLTVPMQADCSVLLVEDTNYNARAASAVLAKFGLTCERASTGAEALKLFAEKRYNLVLLDRNLPDMDGTEVARRIRAMEVDGPRTIMLAVTAYCTSEDRATCLSAGMDAFVGKPLTPEKLRRVLTAAGRRHLAAASMHVSPNVVTNGVDVSLLEYISDGTDQGLNRQIELFLSALGEAEKELETAARGVDFKALADAAHGVLSHARLVGSSTLSSAASTLEKAARNHDKDAFRVPLRQVRSEIQSLKATVRRHPASEQPT
jgi:signal transduction histidine kinase/CheY-like chemotaxis protein/HPt (histidine-containing phosphotransfer) domain-containing protein